MLRGQQAGEGVLGVVQVVSFVGVSFALGFCLFGGGGQEGERKGEREKGGRRGGRDVQRRSNRFRSRWFR